MTEKKHNDFQTQARVFWHFAHQVRRGLSNGAGGLIPQSDQQKMSTINHYETNFVWHPVIQKRIDLLKTQVLDGVKRLKHEPKNTSQTGS